MYGIHKNAIVDQLSKELFGPLLAIRHAMNPTKRLPTSPALGLKPACELLFQDEVRAQGGRCWHMDREPTSQAESAHAKKGSPKEPKTCRVPAPNNRQKWSEVLGLHEDQGWGLDLSILQQLPAANFAVRNVKSLDYLGCFLLPC